MGDMRLEGRTGFVTGGASGIGAATARRLASEGARVVVADIDADRAGKVAADVGGESVKVDVKDVASVRLAVSAAERTVGPIDILVNNPRHARVHARRARRHAGTPPRRHRQRRE